VCTAREAFGGNMADPEIREASDIDAAMVVLRAASGALVHINNGRHCAYGYDQRIEAFGETGMLQAGNRRPKTVESGNAERIVAKAPVLNFSSSATPRPTWPRSTISSIASRRAPARWRGSPRPARRCGWPMPRWKRSAPGRSSGWTADTQLFWGGLVWGRSG